jgi:hypothetical protein
VAKFNVNGSQLIAEYGVKYQAAAMGAIEKEFINTMGKIVEDTPIGIPNSERYTTKPQGNLRHNWQIARNATDRYLLGTSKKGRDYVSKQVKGKLLKGGRLFMFNNAPQINVVEFGGYPDPVKKGTYRKGKGYQVRSSGGYSKQAPRGMVRSNLAGFGQRFRQRAAKALRGVK